MNPVDQPSKLNEVSTTSVSAISILYYIPCYNIVDLFELRPLQNPSENLTAR